MKAILQLFTALAVAGLLVSCSKSGSNSTEPKIPDPTTNPEANASVFQRTCDSINSLIERKEYKQAQEALEVFKKFKLTPEQEKIVEQMRTRIPKAN